MTVAQGTLFGPIADPPAKAPAPPFQRGSASSRAGAAAAAPNAGTLRARVLDEVRRAGRRGLSIAEVAERLSRLHLTGSICARMYELRVAKLVRAGGWIRGAGTGVRQGLWVAVEYGSNVQAQGQHDGSRPQPDHHQPRPSPSPIATCIPRGPSPTAQALLRLRTLPPSRVQALLERARIERLLGGWKAVPDCWEQHSGFVLQADAIARDEKIYDEGGDS